MGDIGVGLENLFVGLVILVVVWWFTFANEPTAKEQKYWDDVVQEGARLKETLATMNLTFRKFAEQPQAIRDAFLDQEGFQPKMVADYIELAKKFPQQRYLTQREIFFWEEYSTMRKSKALMQQTRKGRSR